jgi:hypothetical protein
MWYKFYANHGPGHQSHLEFYEWIPNGWSEEELQENWNFLFRDTDYPIGKAEKVEELPEKVRLEKIKHYESAAKCASYMLKTLGVKQLSLAERVCRTLQGLSLAEFSPLNETWEDMVYRFTHLVPIDVDKSCRCPHDDWMQDFLEAEKISEEAAYTSPKERAESANEENSKKPVKDS